MHEGSRLGGKIGIEILSFKRHRRPSGGRFQRAPIAKSRRSTEFTRKLPMELDYLFDREVPNHFASSRYTFARRRINDRAASRNRGVTFPPSISAIPGVIVTEPVSGWTLTSTL
jgi:hypothetical protein